MPAKLNTYVIWWDPNKQFDLGSTVAVYTPFGAPTPVEGDITYILTLGEGQRLLARLGVMEVQVDAPLQRTIVSPDRFVTAIFSRDIHSGHLVRTPIPVPTGTQHKQVTALGSWESESLQNLCEQNNDYSKQYLPINWDGISNQTLRYIERSRISGDERSDLEIAVGHLLTTYPTCDLPGPAPVYLNSARAITIGSNNNLDLPAYIGKGFFAETADSAYCPSGTGHKTEVRSNVFTRRSAPLTKAVIKAGINANLTKMSMYSPDARRHQEILLRLRNRLFALGLNPLYDRFIDCKVEVCGAPLYFEVKSSQPRNMLREMMLGVGQLEYYQWLDSGPAAGDIKGHLVLEDRGNRKVTIPDFVESRGMGFSWSSGLDDITLIDLTKSVRGLVGSIARRHT